MPGTVLIVEDDELYASMLVRIVTEEGLQAIVAGSGEEALRTLEQVRPVLVLCDLGLPRMDGVAFLRSLADRAPGLTSIVVTGQANVEGAAAAMRAGAFDVLQKSSDLVEIQLRLRRAMENVDLKRQVAYLKQKDERLSEIVGESPAMMALRQRIEDVARSPAGTVLIVGETGTGKELVARAVHHLSERRDKPLVTVNSAAVPDSLVESEFFGVERGAFTGASRARAGLFETAQGGTLFLDEVAELDPRLQAKLLRALEQRIVRRVGGTRDIEVDVRFILASNRDLGREVQLGRFREDLYYRVNVFRIDVPPLRDRGYDVILLARHFLADFRRQLRKPVATIHPGAEASLLDRSFPGNVRQLRNLIEQAVILTRTGQITTQHLEGSDAVRVAAGTSSRSVVSDDARPLDARMHAIRVERELLDRDEIALVRSAMAAAQGRLSTAARLLGISRFALQRRLKRMR